MPARTVSCLGGVAAVAAVLAVGLAGTAATACDRGGCGGRGFHPGPVYSAPPVYSYSPCAAGPCGTRGPRLLVGTYTTRVNIFRGPRWGYAAAYYNPVRRGHCGRHGCGHQAYLTGPILWGVPARRR